MTEISLRQLLDQDGPQPSSSLLRQLEIRGLSPQTARKRLQRLGPEIRRLRGHGLAKNQQFFYLEGDWLSVRFGEALRKAWHEMNSAHGHAVAVLPPDGSFVPLPVLHTRSGAPFALKGQIGIELMLKQLVYLEMVRVQEVPELGGDCVALRRLGVRPERTQQRTRAVLLAELILLNTLRDWLRKSGLVSYEKARIRDDTPRPEFSQWPFDLVGPSYVRPLGLPASAGGKPGFIVADVWLDQRLSLHQVAGFVRKAAIARSMPRTRPFLAILLGDEFTKKAWQRAREQGLVFSTPELLFGKELAAALKELVETLTGLAKNAITQTNLVPRLFERLGRVEGAAANLRGPLFELVVAQALSQTMVGQPEIGKLVYTATGERAEIDVLQRGRTLVRVCECRGHAPGRVVSIDDVKTWCDQRIPRIRGWLLMQDDTRNARHSFEYWTTATYSAEAHDYLKNFSDRTKKYDLKWFSGTEVRDELRRLRMARLVDTLNEHYLLHPMATGTPRAPTEVPAHPASPHDDDDDRLPF